MSDDFMRTLFESFVQGAWVATRDIPHAINVPTVWLENDDPPPVTITTAGDSGEIEYTPYESITTPANHQQKDRK